MDRFYLNGFKKSKDWKKRLNNYRNQIEHVGPIEDFIKQQTFVLYSSTNEKIAIIDEMIHEKMMINKVHEYAFKLKNWTPINKRKTIGNLIYIAIGAVITEMIHILINSLN